MCKINSFLCCCHIETKNEYKQPPPTPNKPLTPPKEDEVTRSSQPPEVKKVERKPPQPPEPNKVERKPPQPPEPNKVERKPPQPPEVNEDENKLPQPLKKPKEETSPPKEVQTEKTEDVAHISASRDIKSTMQEANPHSTKNNDPPAASDLKEVVPKLNTTGGKDKKDSQFAIMLNFNYAKEK